MTDADTRAGIIACAREWLGTPFHDGAAIKDIGVDCAMFVARAYIDSGATPSFDVPAYQAQWMLHSAEERLENFVLHVGGKRIEERQAGPGDLVLYKLAKAFAHAAIIVDWPALIIHAHKLSNRVIEMPPFEYDMRGREVRFYSLWG